MHLIPSSNHAPPVHPFPTREVRRRKVKLSVPRMFWKKKIKRIDPMALQVPNKGEPVNLIQPKGLKRLECIIDSLVDIVRTQHGCCNSVARWGRGGSKSQPVLRASFLELDVPYGA